MEVVNTVLGFVRDYLLQPAIQHTGYAFHVKTEIKKLRAEMEKLIAMEEDVGRQLEVAPNPSSVVQMWQSKVKSLKEKVEPDLKMELNCDHFCSNFLSRYKLGKRVAGYLVVAKELEGEASGFGAGTSIDLNLPYSAKANFESLCEEVKTLSHIEADVNSKVDEAKRVQGLQPNYRVEGWLQRVIAHKRDVADICSKFQGMKEENDNERKVLADLNLRVHNILEKTKALISEGQGFGSNVSYPSRPVQVVRQSEITSVGQDKAYWDVQNLIQSGSSGIIGIYGMGGVGKTTLLKRINNSLIGLDYEIVIFVVVSKDGNIASVQKDILKTRMGKDVENTSSLQRESIIRNCLQDKKFLLLLDDIWNWLNLEDVGVPISNCKNNSNSKILFTTRFENVCDQMKAKKVKIECLNDEEAWELFETTVGTSFLNSNFDIKEIAEDVAKECGGLPLALTVIGGAMRSKRKIEGWKHALTTLRKSQPEITGAEEHLYNRLRFSYDSLPNEIMKECFCYCALFPEDYEIVARDIVGCWIGEGFFDGCDNIDEARNKGYDIIEDLKQACLLEGVNDDNNYVFIKVKLHDVVRDMALWIKKGKFVVVTTRAKVPKMEEVERLSIMISDGELGDLNQTPLVCPKLSSFLIEHELVEKLSDEFFQGTTNLKVLMCVCDPRTITKYGRLPSSIRNLVNLRYLNLGRVGKELLGSWELGELQSLEHLTMQISTDNDQVSLELGVIGRLSNLRVLDLLPFIGGALLFLLYGFKIGELKNLRALEDLALPISSSSDLRGLAVSPELAHSVSSLLLTRLSGMKSFVLVSEIGRMNRLKILFVHGCESVEKIVVEEEDDRVKSTSQQDHVVPPRSSIQYPKLTSMLVISCARLHTVMCVGITPLVLIQGLLVVNCHRVEQVFKQCTRSEGSAEYVFQELQDIVLSNLSNLKSICSDAFTFPDLEVLIVLLCPNLKKLPRGIIQASKLREIRGEPSWWDGLEWDSLEDKTSLLPFFTKCNIFNELLDGE